MGIIKTDEVEVLGEVEACNDALNNLKEIIGDFLTNYPEVLGEQKSNEFIKEFWETLDEQKENITKTIEEGTTVIIDAMKETTITFANTDESIAKAEIEGSVS